MSDPPEEEEQEKECEDVGVAYFRISDILMKQRDMIDISLDGEFLCLALIQVCLSDQRTTMQSINELCPFYSIYDPNVLYLS